MGARNAKAERWWPRTLSLPAPIRDMKLLGQRGAPTFPLLYEGENASLVLRGPDAEWRLTMLFGPAAIEVQAVTFKSLRRRALSAMEEVHCAIERRWSDVDLYQPPVWLHPGTTVLDYIESRGWSQRRFAQAAKLTPKLVSQLCAGKAPISAKTALALEGAFGRPAQFWLNLQSRFEEGMARHAASEMARGVT